MSLTKVPFALLDDNSKNKMLAPYENRQYPAGAYCIGSDSKIYKSKVITSADPVGSDDWENAIPDVVIPDVNFGTPTRTHPVKDVIYTSPDYDMFITIRIQTLHADISNEAAAYLTLVFDDGRSDLRISSFAYELYNTHGSMQSCLCGIIPANSKYKVELYYQGAISMTYEWRKE